MSVVDPIANFFASYPSTGFVYDRNKGTLEEFERLSSFRQWVEGGKRKQKAIFALQRALQKEFELVFGKQDGDYQQWCDLCRTLGIVPIPGSRVKHVHVNVFDVVDAQRQGRQATPIFRNVQQLKTYTIENGMTFPKKRAKRGLLKYLLRNIGLD
ncbi:hypothetical protein M422DRAFT_268735 [Sphaerobolus stellatus SS14]|uniref:Uncharacterized protein n=1 Tax=Sphaerobolus stellatus (strain SS14) TaxID=990650 RepID=A0A0C9TJI9_SPHS4|nr:hypothetical protein M422DRAFT_268735 [Sphaerobolus stellatus SS14]